jgi:hypothetical protein
LIFVSERSLPLRSVNCGFMPILEPILYIVFFILEKSAFVPELISCENVSQARTTRKAEGSLETKQKLHIKNAKRITILIQDPFNYHSSFYILLF